MENKKENKVFIGAYDPTDDIDAMVDDILSKIEDLEKEHDETE